MPSILPRSVDLRSGRWWTLVTVLAVATFFAAIGSYAITLTDLMISPMLLTPGVGTALLLRWGYSIWPGFLAGDLIGQLMVRDRPWTHIVVIAIVRLVIVIAGAAWMRRARVGFHSLSGTMRYAGISTTLALIAGSLTILLISVYGEVPPGASVVIIFGLVTLAYVGGYLVAGGLMMAWAVDRRDIRADLHNWWAIAGTAVTIGLAIGGFGWGIGLLVPLALLGVLAVAARGGPRWSTLAMAFITTAAIVGDARGLAPFGGTTGGWELTNTMLAISLFALAALLLAGYRSSDEGTVRPAPVVAGFFGIFMVIAGISMVAINQVTVIHDTPFVNSGLLALGAGLGLGMLRLARTPPRPTSRKGFILAAVAGAVYVANLAVFLQAVPLIGSAASTALSMTAPLAVVVLAIVVERTRPSGGVVLAVVMIVIGAIFYASGITWDTQGVVLALGSAWIFAASLIFMTRALAHSNVIDVALIGALASAAVALPVGLIVEGAGAFTYTTSEIGALALGALGAQLVPQLGRSWALAQIGPSPVGAIGVLAPVVTIALSMWLLSGAIDTGAIGGLIMIVAGAIIATLAGTRGRHGTDGAHAEVLTPHAQGA